MKDTKLMIMVTSGEEGEGWGKSIPGGSTTSSFILIKRKYDDMLRFNKTGGSYMCAYYINFQTLLLQILYFKNVMIIYALYIHLFA